MSNPFTICRARRLSDNAVIEGSLDNEGFIRTFDDHFFKVDEHSLQFNTGLFDHDGVEIFTGDSLRRFFDTERKERTLVAKYLPDEGAFFVEYFERSTFQRTEYRTLDGRQGQALIKRNDTVFERLTQNAAHQLLIDRGGDDAHD